MGIGSRLYDLLRRLWISWDARLDRRLGVDFSTWADNETIGIDPQIGNQYQPSTQALSKVLRRFPITEEDAIIDIGCGKGKVLYLMSDFPFGKIAGLELSPYLVEIAKDNTDILGLEHCHLINDDASVFSDYDSYNYFYVFNSFPAEIFRMMLGHIMASLERKPRRAIFIYLNPVCHELLVEAGFIHSFTKRSLIQWFNYACYEYNPPYPGEPAGKRNGVECWD